MRAPSPIRGRLDEFVVLAARVGGRERRGGVGRRIRRVGRRRSARKRPRCAPSAGRGPSRSSGRRCRRCAQPGRPAHAVGHVLRATPPRSAAACRGRRGRRAPRRAARRRRPPSRPSRQSAARDCARRRAKPGPARAASRGCFARSHRLDQRRIAGEFAGLDRVIDAREFLVDDTAGADVQMTDFGIAHLPARKADGELGSVDRRVRDARASRRSQLGFAARLIALSGAASRQPTPSRISSTTGTTAAAAAGCVGHRGIRDRARGQRPFTLSFYLYPRFGRAPPPTSVPTSNSCRTTGRWSWSCSSPERCWSGR